MVAAVGMVLAVVGVALFRAAVTGRNPFDVFREAIAGPPKGAGTVAPR